MPPPSPISFETNSGDRLPPPAATIAAMLAGVAPPVTLACVTARWIAASVAVNVSGVLTMESIVTVDDSKLGAVVAGGIFLMPSANLSPATVASKILAIATLMSALAVVIAVVAAVTFALAVEIWARTAFNSLVNGVFTAWMFSRPAARDLAIASRTLFCTSSVLFLRLSSKAWIVLRTSGFVKTGLSGFSRRNVSRWAWVSARSCSRLRSSV